MALTYRSAKGSALTFDELDNNFRALTGSQTISGTLSVTSGARVTGSLTVSGSNTFTNIGSFSQTGGSIFSGSVEISGSLTLSKIQSAAATDASFYIINGSRGEIRSQLQTGVAADTGFRLELRNTSIKSTSLIVANVIGGNGGILTGSVVTANVIADSSASLNFFNTGEALANDAKFTASFAIF